MHAYLGFGFDVSAATLPLNSLSFLSLFLFTGKSISVRGLDPEFCDIQPGKNDADEKSFWKCKNLLIRAPGKMKYMKKKISILLITKGYFLSNRRLIWKCMNNDQILPDENLHKYQIALFKKF